MSEENKPRQFWVLKENVKNGDVPTSEPDYPELFYHTIELAPMLEMMDELIKDLARAKDAIGDKCIFPEKRKWEWETREINAARLAIEKYKKFKEENRLTKEKL